MKLEKRHIRTITIHLTIWLVILLVKAYALNINLGDHLLVLDFSLYAFFFYLNTCLLVPKFLNGDKRLQFVVINVILIMALSTIQAYATFFFIGRQIIVPSKTQENIMLVVNMSFKSEFLMASLYNTYVFIFSFAYSTYSKSIVADREKSELIEKHLTHNLAKLRSQINPELLSLILKKIRTRLQEKSNHEVVSGIEKLSKLMRYMIYRKEDGRTTLSMEIEHIGYLTELLNPQKHNRLELFGVNKNNVGLKIEPTILLSLAEAVYWINEKGTTPLELKISLQDAKISLFLLLEKREEAFYNEKLKRIRERLNIAYQNAHSLGITGNNLHLEIDLA